MSYFKQQKESQEGIENYYFEPLNTYGLKKLTLMSHALLEAIDGMQERIESSVNFINGKSPFKNEQKDNAELETRVRAKQRLLTSYKKVLEEINKQVSSL